jgi:hypothetical protein
MYLRTASISSSSRIARSNDSGCRNLPPALPKIPFAAFAIIPFIPCNTRLNVHPVSGRKTACT